MDAINALYHVMDGPGSCVCTLVLTVKLEVSRVHRQCDVVMHR